VEGQLRGPLNVPQVGIQFGGGETASLFLEAGANRDDRHRHSSRVIHIHLRVQVGGSLKREEMKALQVAIPTRLFLTVGPEVIKEGMRAGEGLHTIPEKEMSIETKSILADPREIQQGGLDD